jgi:hypothetical protein
VKTASAASAQMRAARASVGVAFARGLDHGTRPEGGGPRTPVAGKARQVDRPAEHTHRQPRAARPLVDDHPAPTRARRRAKRAPPPRPSRPGCWRTRRSGRIPRPRPIAAWPRRAHSARRRNAQVVHDDGIVQPFDGTPGQATGLEQHDPRFGRVQHADLEALFEAGHEPVTIIGCMRRAQAAGPPRKRTSGRRSAATLSPNLEGSATWRSPRAVRVSWGNSCHAGRRFALICRKLRAPVCGVPGPPAVVPDLTVH